MADDLSAGAVGSEGAGPQGADGEDPEALAMQYVILMEAIKEAQESNAEDEQ